ncbi:ankyrin repeat-containing domain protein [Xylaria digitata]|nr:ankyrin repeat-containing domain protein [Xylaria digitata]
MGAYSRTTRKLSPPPLHTRQLESRFVLAVKSEDPSHLQQLLQYGYVGDINWRGPDGMCALHWAARLGRANMLMLLLPLMHPDTTDDNHRTALFYAIENDTKAPEIIGLLLQRGAKATWADSEGKTALRLAVETGKIDAARKPWDGIILLFWKL